jgi:transcription antitermination factor NusG
MDWFAFRTAPRKELAVEDILRRRGLNAFCPTETKWRSTGRGRRMPHDYPLLPRYIFAGGADPWAIVKSLDGRGLLGVLTVADVPAPIPDEAIKRLARISGGLVPSKTTRVHRAFQPGAKVEITAGPFRGWIVPVDSIKGEIAKVLLPMFGGAVQEVPVKLDCLEAA